MWHDIVPEADAAYNLWHTREHMPERIALPGFLRSRRGVNKVLARQHYFTLYECENMESTVSAEYQQSLNYPTEWTKQVAPHFRNFKRMSCETAISRGRGVGGSIATFRALLQPGVDEVAMTTQLAAMVDAILDVPAVTGAHVAFSRPNFTNGETTEVTIRPVMTEPDFSIVIVVEGVDLAATAAHQDAIQSLLAEQGLTEIIAQSYDMAYMLDIATAE